MFSRPLISGITTAAGHSAAVLFLASMSPALHGQDAENAEMRPPFGLAWGESAELLETAIAQAGGKITQRR